MASTFVTVPATRPFLSVVPQADRVLIRLEDLPEKSSGGVLLPKSAVKFERYLMGEVLSVGAEAGEVKAGKKVLFSDINAYEAIQILSSLQIETLYLCRIQLGACLYSMYNIDSTVIYKSHHWDNGFYICLGLDETVQIDLGTDAKHCFCKAGDLLAVVE
ncbi:hypothetical protein DKX38_020662 [Salix brachista]|uniref:10 kDa chaperonin n=1 Tax=Salix brachista TaxID=2182728 RepID=A0A5N5KB30_9ROSI|nr:hypothetical protein DKX38_020662 [Salix brachista]